MQEVIRTKALELSCEMPMPTNTGKFKASTDWCVCMMRQAGLALRHQTTLMQRLHGEYAQVPAACYKTEKAALVYAGPYRKCRSDTGIF
jgi:uroporphyrinogen-III decarboxylase